MNWKNVYKRHEKIILISSIKHFFDYIIIFFIIFLIDLTPLILDGGKGGFGRPIIETQSARQLKSIYSQMKYCIVITIAKILILCLIVWILYFLFYNLYLHIRIKKNIIKYENVTEVFIRWAYENKINVSQKDKFKVFAPIKWSLSNDKYFCIRIPVNHNNNYKYQFYQYK